MLKNVSVAGVVLQMIGRQKNDRFDAVTDNIADIYVIIAMSTFHPSRFLIDNEIIHKLLDLTNDNKSHHVQPLPDSTHISLLNM